MATTVQKGFGDNIPEKHRAKLIELEKKGKLELANLNLLTQSKAVAHAEMWNYTPGAMPFNQNNDWSGSIIGRYPIKIDLNREASFTHNGTPPTDSMGSYGVVIYSGTNQAGVANNCAWLLAWHVPGDGTNNKVYVETGPITKYPAGAVNWDTFKTALENSSNTSYYVDDNNTRAEATASITATGNTATIAVTFDLN